MSFGKMGVLGSGFGGMGGGGSGPPFHVDSYAVSTLPFTIYVTETRAQSEMVGATYLTEKS